jgi:vacuolar iron transporter family protein
MGRPWVWQERKWIQPLPLGPGTPPWWRVVRDAGRMRRWIPIARQQQHRSGRVGWLRAAVLGADDGIVSTASLMIGVAAAAASVSTILVAGLAGLVAGAMSMAAGEYVSVSSQRDAERADITRERHEQQADPDLELAELTDIYVRRGLDEQLAGTVAATLMRADPLATHLREELGLSAQTRARPVQAALVSAASFAAGAALPLLALLLAPPTDRVTVIAASALGLLALLGAVGGRLGGAAAGPAAVRVALGGGRAMAATALIGRLVGATGL